MKIDCFLTKLNNEFYFKRQAREVFVNFMFRRSQRRYTQQVIAKFILIINSTKSLV